MKKFTGGHYISKTDFNALNMSITPLFNNIFLSDCKAPLNGEVKCVTLNGKKLVYTCVLTTIFNCLKFVFLPKIPNYKLQRKLYKTLSLNPIRQRSK